MIPLDSTEPVDVREAYSQGMRATVSMLRECLSALPEPFATDLGIVLRVADRKIEEWAEAAMFA